MAGLACRRSLLAVCNSKTLRNIHTLEVEAHCDQRCGYGIAPPYAAVTVPPLSSCLRSFANPFAVMRTVGGNGNVVPSWWVPCSVWAFISKRPLST